MPRAPDRSQANQRLAASSLVHTHGAIKIQPRSVSKTLFRNLDGGVMILQKGQKVRLTERGLKFHTSVSGQHAPRQNWDRRIGTVKRVTRSKTYAVIAWDGNASLADALPLTFFEPA
jgi:hypothetical protein